MIKKKISLAIIILILLPTTLLAVIKEPTTKSFDIQGVYGTTLSLSVDPISAQVSSYIAGMPFNILDAQVNPEQVSGGRQIARWSAASNTLFTIKVSADHMYHVNNVSTKEDPLEYILTFKYDVSVSDQSYEDQVFTVTSGTGEHEFNLANNLSSVGNGFVGILNGGIFFRFTNTGWTIAHSDSAPEGEYIAEVTIKLIGR